MQAKPSRTTFRNRLDEMITALRDDIVTGRLKSGEFIPSLMQLSKQFQLSINSVQKGLDQLAAESLIERIPRVGIRVKDSTRHSTVSLSFGYYPSLMEDVDLQHLIAAFQEEHPHIRIQPVPLQYENYYDVTSNYLYNEMLDVLTINHINFNQYEDGHTDIREVFEPIKPAAGIYPYLSPPFMRDKTQYVQPIVFSPVILCYNQQHFEQRQADEPPLEWTWQEFMACLDRLGRDESRLAFYFYPATLNRWPIFLLQSGVEFKRNKTGKMNLAAPQIMDSIQTCNELIQRQNMFQILLSENDVNVEELFSQQRISVMMTTYFNMNRLRRASFPFDIAPLPYVHTPKTLLITIGMAINRRSKQKAAAQVFIDYLTSYRSQLHIRKTTYSIPALQRAAEWHGEELGYRPSRYNIYRDISHTYALLSDLNLNPHEIEELLNAMNMYWMGMENKEATLSRLATI